MCARVGRALVETDPGNRAVRRGHELDAEGGRTGIVDGDCAGRRTWTEQGLCGRRIVHADGDVAGGRGLSIRDRVGEAGRSDIAGRRHEADGLRARIVADRAADGIADTRER